MQKILVRVKKQGIFITKFMNGFPLTQGWCVNTAKLSQKGLKSVIENLFGVEA